MTHLGTPEIEELLGFGLKTIREAGDEAMRFYGKGDNKTKFDEALVTRAELHLSEFFKARLEAAFPEHGLFGETAPGTEYVHGAKGYLWIFDALDGVANFQAGIPVWGISIALLENFWPILGIHYMPVTGDIFYARAGEKAFWNDKEMRVPKTGDVSNESLLLTYSRFHNHYRSTFPGKIRNLGSTAAHICYVARGRAEAALLANVSYQDLAAAQIILNAAGGKICTLDGREFHLSEYLGGQRITEHLLAAPVGAHNAIQMYIKEPY